MKRFLVAGLVLTVAVMVGSAHGQDKADPTGTWKWSVMGGGGGGGGRARETTLKLKFEGGKLTGAIAGRNNQDTAIEDGSFKDGVVSFKVTRERQGNKTTTKYEGKLDGDTIKGKTTTERDGQPQSRDWEAKRSKS